MGLCEFLWVGNCVTALAAWWGVTARRRRKSVHRLAKTASRLCFGALVYTVAPLVATRAASGGTSAPTTMARRWHPLGDRLPLGRKKQLPRELRRR